MVPASTRPVKGKPKAAVATAKLKAPAPKPTGVKIKILRQEAAIKPLYALPVSLLRALASDTMLVLSVYVFPASVQTHLNICPHNCHDH